MADDTGTDWAAVAEVIVGWSCTNEECDHHECKFLRAASVGLRRLAQLDTAIAAHRSAHCTVRLDGDPVMPWGCCEDDNVLWAAVLGSGEQPEGPTCPTCGSDARRWALGSTRWGSTLMEPHHCPDSWHGEQR